MIQLKIKSLEILEGSPLIKVSMQDIASDRGVEIFVGWPEAAAIQAHLEGATPPRPMTHDLMANMLSTLQAKVLHLTISDMRDETFFALLTVSAGGKVHEIDCRPSDGIALAVRAAAPIYISEELMGRLDEIHKEKETPAPRIGSILVEREDTTIH